MLKNANGLKENLGDSLPNKKSKNPNDEFGEAVGYMAFAVLLLVFIFAMLREWGII